MIKDTRQSANTTLTERDLLENQFKYDHRKDSDEQLLDYVRQVAEELGHTPSKTETIGYRYLKQRLGNWPKIMVMSGLKKPTSERK